MNDRENIIHNYVNAYKKFDIDGMMKDLDDNVRFENIMAGEQTWCWKHLTAFKEQAEQATAFFQRKQTITSFKHHADKTEVTIHYNAVLICDLSNGMKKGDVLNPGEQINFRFFRK